MLLIPSCEEKKLSLELVLGLVVFEVPASLPVIIVGDVFKANRLFFLAGSSSWSSEADGDLLDLLIVSEVAVVPPSDYEYNQDVPSDTRLENLASADESILSFQDRQDNGGSAFRLTQVPANKMSHFNKAFFIQLNPNLQLNQNKKFTW